MGNGDEILELNSFGGGLAVKNKMTYSFIKHIFRATLKFRVETPVLPYFLPGKLTNPYYVV